MVLVWLGKFVGVTEYDLPLAVLSPVGLGAAKRPRVHQTRYGSGFAAPGQEEQMRENQGVRIVEMFSCGTIQIVKFLLAGDA